MSKLETVQSIWEKSTKIFDKIEDKNKIEWFNSLIDELEENNSINWIKDKWNSMSEEQKEKLYKMNAITVSEFLKRWSPIYQLYKAIVNWAKNTKKHGWKNALKYAFLEQVPCRFFVELWILDKPKSLTKEKLVEDAKKDAKNFNIYLWICEVICTCIPETKAVWPLIAIARHYTKWYKDHWVEVVSKRINDKRKFNISQQTKKELAEAIVDIENNAKSA